MTYRGDDLDLRTPRTWTAAGDMAGWSEPEASLNGPKPGRSAETSTPIWVDETVLACCNQAFDMAEAHGSAEVRIEHVLNAMTRNDAAAEVLEEHGVRVVGLRRDTAAAIAGEGALLDPNSRVGPRRSDEVEEVLRRAAGRGHRRAAPASADDVIAVLMDPYLDVRGQSWIARNLSRSSRELPPPTRSLPDAYDSPPAGSYEARDRWRAVPQSHYYPETVRPAPWREPDRHGVAGRAEPMLAEILDRLCRLEQMLREQKPLPALQEGVTHLEAVVETGLETAAREWAVTAEKLTEIEGQLRDQSAALAGNAIGGRLDMIEEALLVRDAETHRDMGARLDKLAERLEVDRADAKAVVLAQSAAAESGMAGAASRLMSAFDERGETLKQAVAGVAARQDSLFAALERWRRDSASLLDGFTARLSRVEQASTRNLGLLEQFGPVLQTVHRLVIDRQHWRRRLSLWLFGTVDWVAASWPAHARHLDSVLADPGEQGTGY